MMTATTLKFTKIRAGWYATEDGRYAVIVDGYGYVPVADRDYNGSASDGWSAVIDPQGRLREDHQAGETLDWFDTKRDAVAYCASHAR
jgi:hypothetical protein